MAQQTKTEQIHFLMSKEEYAAVRKAAKRLEISVGEFLRRAAAFVISRGGK